MYVGVRMQVFMGTHLGGSKITANFTTLISSRTKMLHVMSFLQLSYIPVVYSGVGGYLSLGVVKRWLVLLLHSNMEHYGRAYIVHESMSVLTQLSLRKMIFSLKRKCRKREETT